MPAQHDLAYARTPAGQSACISDFPLSTANRRLLLLVNGYTPIQHLAERMALDEPQQTIDALLAGGLIEPVTHAPGHR